MNPDQLDPNLINPTEEELEKQQQPDSLDRAQDLKDKFDQAKDLRGKFQERFGPKTTDAKAAKNLGKSGLKGVEKKTAQQASRKVATQGGRIAGKAAAQVGAEVATTAAGEAAGVGAATAAGATVGSVAPVVGTIIGAIVGFLIANAGKIWKKAKEYWKVPLYIAGGLFLVLAFVFGLIGAKGSPKYPATAGEKGQAAVAGAVAGSPAFDSTVTQASVDSEKQRYIIVQQNVDRTIASRSGEVKVKIKEILDLESQAVGLHGAAKKSLVTQINQKVNDLDNSLPFGQWIKDFALSRVDHPSQEFCQITHAASSVACASFVTTVLQNVGAKLPIDAAVDNVWRMKALKTIVNRPDSRSEGYYADNKSKLQVGDLIFWGDGSCSAGGSVLFDHIGVYVGGDQAVDNSSSTHVIKKRQAAKRDNSCRFFNGAKRYGADL